MPKKSLTRSIVDLALWGLLSSIAATALILEYRLVPGREGGRGLSLLSLDRHEWGNVHFWLGVAFLTMLFVHLSLNLAFISSVICRKSRWAMVTFGTATGEKVQAGQKVWVHYHGWLQDGTVFDSSIRREKPFKFTTGKGMVIAGFERAVMRLAPGEGAYVVIPSELAYRGMPINVIPPFANLVYKIEVLGVK